HGVHGVVGGAVVDRSRGPLAPVDRVRLAVAGSEDLVGAVAAHDLVHSGVAGEDVVPLVADEPVVERVTGQDVGVAAATHMLDTDQLVRRVTVGGPGRKVHRQAH